jgi:predicted O-methyltransferase YrrM
MAASMGQFTYEMVLQFAQFQDALNKQASAASAAATKIQSSLQSAADSITKSFQNVAAAIGIGLSIDKLVELGKAVTDQADKITNLSKVIGVSTQTLDVYTYAATLAGGGLDTVSESAQKLSKSLASAEAGNKQMQANFAAIGISATQLAALIKNPDTAIQVVAQHFAQYSDSIDKAALAQQIFGRGGAEQIPFLNKLGTSFDALSAQAQQFGLVLSDVDQNTLVAFKASSVTLGQQIQGVANQIMVGMAPALTNLNTALGKLLNSGDVQDWGKEVGDVINSVIQYFNNMSLGATQIFGFLDTLWIKFSTGGQIALAYIEFTLDGVIADVKNTLAEAWDQIQNFGKNLTSGSSFGVDFDNSIAQATGKLPSVQNVVSPTEGPSVDALSAKITALWKNMQTQIAVSKDAVQASLLDTDATNKLGASTDAAGSKIAKLPGNVDAAAEALKRFQDDLSKLSDLEDQLNSSMGGPYLAALKTYQKGIDETAKTWADAVAAGQANEALINRLSDDQEKLGVQLDNTNAQIKAQHDLMAQQTQDFANLVAVQGVAPDQQAALTDGLKKYDDLLKSHFDFYGNYIEDTDKLTAALNNQLPGYVAAEQKINDFNKTLKLNEQAAQEWQGIWKTAGDGIADTFSKILVEGGSLMDGLKSIAQQTVEAIISYFAKLAVINPILNSIFGGQQGYSVLPTLSNAGGILGGGGGGVGGIGSGGGIGNIFSGISNLFGGGGAAAAASAGQSVGVFSDLGAGANSTIGTSTAFTTDWGAAGNAFSDGLEAGAPDIGTSLGTSAGSSFLGTAIPVISGLIAGLGEFKAAGGGLGGLAGGAAYGIGTASLAIGAGAALSGGLAAGLAAVPVVGWIAIGAMVLDKLTGGGLFGTAWKPTGNTGVNISTTAGGADIDATAEEKKKQALFAGSKTKTVSVDVPQSDIDDLNKFFDTLNTGLAAYAAQFKKTGEVLDSSFSQTFDKKGNVTSTTENIGGQSYNDTTVQDYQSRLQALSFEKVITDMGIDVSKFVDNTQDATDLLAQVQSVAATVQEANTNLTNGFKFLGLGANETLNSVINFTEGLNVAGETLQQTYERLVAAQQQYDQFVAQFAPATSYVDPFEQSIATLYDQMNAAMASANAYAKAAGAAGATQKDLTNIMTFYTSQMAAATVQLQASAQSLAFSLGLTTQGTLDQVDQAISDLQNSATTASSSVSGFGDTIAAVSQKATDAMNLLLGDLSPLNDQQKLQTALQGLRAGTVTADQVLEIGRRLYASSQQYNDLFKQVMATPSGAKASRGNSNSGSGGSSTSTFNINNLSPADQAKYKALLAEQSTLQASQTLGQYQTLAQQIAELATAKGESYTDVLKEMGVQQADLEKGLGLKDDAALQQYISGVQAQLDSAGDNTTSIVNAIVALPAQIAAALYGESGLNTTARFAGGGGTQVNGTRGIPGQTYVPPPPSATGVTNTTTVQPVTPIGTGRAIPGGSITESVSSQIEIGVSRGIAPLAARIDASNRRNVRWLANA